MMLVVKLKSLFLIIFGWVLLSNCVLGVDKVMPKEAVSLFMGMPIEELIEPFDQATLNNLILKAEQGDVQSQFLLGRIYREDRYVSSDYDKAFYWMSKAAAQGHLKAHAFLGIMKVRGIGTPKKYVDGTTLIKKAAYNGDDDGQYFLGMLYIDGIGVPKNYFRAMHWLDKAYQQNHIGAKGIMGYFLFYMSEAPQDKARATYLMKDACSAGDKLVCNKLRLLFIRSVEEQNQMVVKR